MTELVAEERVLPTFGDMAYGPMGKSVRKAMPHTEGDPVAVLAALLALFSGLASPYVVQPNGRPAVVWTALVGPSNQGAKGTSYKAALRILGKNFERYLTAAKLSAIHSGPGLVQVLAADRRSSFPGRMYLTFEWSNDMARTNKCSSYGEVMINVWDGESISNTTKGRGGSAEPVEEHVEHPLMGFHAHVQPRTLRLAIKPQRAATGLYNRFLLFNSKRSKRLSQRVQRPFDEIKPSKGLAEAFRWVMEEQPAMEWSEEAIDVLDDLTTHYDRLIDELPEELGVFIERSVEQIMRVATILAVTQMRNVIPADAVRAAAAIVDYAAQSATEVMRSPASSGPGARSLQDRIRDALKRHGGVMTLSALTSALGGGRTPADKVREAFREMPDVATRVLPKDPGKPGPAPLEVRLLAAGEAESATRPSLRVVRPPAVPRPVPVSARRKAPKSKPKTKKVPQGSFAHLI
ncbi:DUF3987 domain-containing protein [Streptomyces sp. NPDC051561]|uniref:DUF3987 domain-containing protein n=1 Tax=Streptomyces sp. NPDC051561 TaxID=3365658 RepID=UPI0037984C81